MPGRPGRPAARRGGGEGNPRDCLRSAARSPSTLQVRAHLGVGNALLATGRPEEALPAYYRAAELDGKSAAAWKGQAKALAAAGRDNEAAKARDTAAEMQALRVAADRGRA